MWRRRVKCFTSLLLIYLLDTSKFCSKHKISDHRHTYAKKMIALFCLVFLEIFHAFSMTTGRSSFEDCSFERETLKCRGNLPKVKYKSNVTVLEWSFLPLNVLDLNYILEEFPNLQNISIRNSSIGSIIPPESDNNVKILKLNNLQLTEIGHNFLEHFPNIEMLSLEGNNLTKISPHFVLGNIKTFHLGNNKWNCSKNLVWVLHLNITAAKDLHTLTCYGLPYAGKEILPISRYQKDMRDTCTPTCECSLQRVAKFPTSGKLEPIITVNCSYRGFTELPTRFPRYTRIMHLEGNAIMNLRALKFDRIYRSLWDLYLDDNNVHSISVLEGSHWLSHFRAFSLRGNKLSKLPAFALDNALMKNPHMPDAVGLYLGGNSWRCDCVFIPVFQEFVLQKYASQVKDIQEVKCSYVEGDENSLLPISGLSRSSVCRLPTEYSLQEGLDLLNAVLASLIVLILAKLAYDYYQYKKTGRLPWIVTKMP